MDKIESSFVDFIPLKEETLGDSAIYKMLIELFIVGIDEYVNTMNSELDSNNWDALFQVAHKILPSIRMFSISKLEPIISQLESNLRNRVNLERTRMYVDSSLFIFKEVKIELQTELTLLDETKI